MSKELDLANMDTGVGTIVKEVVAILEGVTGRSMDKLENSTPFDQLDIDSLDRIKTLVQIEKHFKISLDESSAAQINTVKDLAQLITITQRQQQTS